MNYYSEIKNVGLTVIRLKPTFSFLKRINKILVNTGWVSKKYESLLEEEQ